MKDHSFLTFFLKKYLCPIFKFYFYILFPKVEIYTKLVLLYLKRETLKFVSS